jgi:hypothetical protein
VVGGSPRARFAILRLRRAACACTRLLTFTVLERIESAARGLTMADAP